MDSRYEILDVHRICICTDTVSEVVTDTCECCEQMEPLNGASSSMQIADIKYWMYLNR